MLCLYINLIIVKLSDFSFIRSFGVCGNLFPSMSVFGEVSDTLISFLLPVSSGTSVTHLAIALCAPPYFVLTTF